MENIKIIEEVAILEKNEDVSIFYVSPKRNSIEELSITNIEKLFISSIVYDIEEANQKEGFFILVKRSDQNEESNGDIDCAGGDGSEI